MSDHPDQVTLALSAGDAVAIDYRLLHGTHANTTESRRDCLVLNFAPCWSALPDDIRAHLIRHPALPADEDAPTASWASTLLPSYGGLRRDLPLTRAAPRRFTIERQGD
jgi:ectoine hydroxylase-related dioxygenase (phytanoyl-CoA dioxygenase family)